MLLEFIAKLSEHLCYHRMMLYRRSQQEGILSCPIKEIAV